MTRRITPTARRRRRAVPQVLSLEGRALLATFFVTSNLDGGTGSLRQAITTANSVGGTNVIDFNIAGTGGHSIAVLSALPKIASGLTIDGTSQPGYANRPVIELNGGQAGASASGLDSTASGDVNVSGLVINGFGANGIFFEGSGGGTVAGCYIGTNAGGTAAQGNLGRGVMVGGGSGAVRIGTTPGGARDLISGNGLSGVEDQSVFAGAMITGAFIGTDVGGTAAIPNGQDGVRISNNSTTIDMSTISGNRGNGVLIVGSSQGSTITNSRIGTDVTGAVALANQNDGVNQTGSFATPLILKGDIISSNALTGVVIVDSGSPTTSAAQITGTYIGTNPAGANLGNGGSGINVNANLVFIANNVIGNNGFVALSKKGAGVTVGTPTSNFHGTNIQSNSIYGNAGLGIDLGGSGTVLLNQTSSSSTGPDFKNNFPVLTSVVSTSGGTTITGTLTNFNGASSRIDFFSNASADPSGYGQGKNYIGFTTLAAGSPSPASFNVTLPVGGLVGQVITATATDPTAGTSEFSKDFTATATAPGVLSVTTVTPPTDQAAIGSDYQYIDTVTNNGSTPATNVVVGDNLPTGVTFRSASTSLGGTPTRSGTFVTASLGTLAPGASATVTIHVNPRTLGPIFNDVAATTNGANKATAGLASRVVASPTSGDFTGDGKPDMSVYGADPITGKQRFKIVTSDSGFNPANAITFDNNGNGYGNSRSIPVPADYFGDGRSAYALWTPNTVGGMTFQADPFNFSRPSVIFGFGQTNDVPVVADVDGDGRADFGVYGPLGPGLGFGYDFLLSSFNFDPRNQDVFNNPPFGYGSARAIPVVADFDGSGHAGFGLFDQNPAGSTFESFTKDTNFSISPRPVGRPTDIPTAVDISGDGKDDLVLYGPGADGKNRFVVLSSSANFNPSQTTTFDNGGFGYGNAQSVPVPADYEGIGTAAYAVFTPDGKGGMEFVYQKPQNGATVTVDFAAANDIALTSPVYLRAAKVRGRA